MTASTSSMATPSSQQLRADVAHRTACSESPRASRPVLAVVLVGDNPASPGVCAQQGQGLSDDAGLHVGAGAIPGHH